jgi:hypothetical protein
MEEKSQSSFHDQSNTNDVPIGQIYPLDPLHFDNTDEEELPKKKLRLQGIADDLSCIAQYGKINNETYQNYIDTTGESDVISERHTSKISDDSQATHTVNFRHS